MRRALNIKNKLGFIDGKILKPSTDFDPLYTAWERCNDMVIAWIQHSVGFEHRASIAHANTAAAVWNDLRERFSIQNAPRIFQLTKSISALTQDEESISQYYNKLKGLWDELEIYEPMPSCTCGAVKTLLDYTHRSKVMQFLNGLHESFDAIHAQILLHDPLPALNRVLSLIQQEERRRQLNSPLAPIAMAARGPDQRNHSSSRKDRLFCTHCNIQGHSLERCFKANPNLPVCSHCCIPGHTREKCYKLHGFPPGYKNNSKIKSHANQSSLEQEQIGNGSPITQEQYTRLLALLQSPQLSVPTSIANHTCSDSSTSGTSPISGPFLLEDDWHGDNA
ncbi:hypothetical protein F2P56_020078 [Juglans regia]|uniref:Retrotransposon gag domain-containing protein n=1 Tax=Juglans regia TaxID=51240 RepID=A0A833X599_JUGRE|nr:hypothetical protein F2P56_020078 [Juglans regia]